MSQSRACGPVSRASQIVRYIAASLDGFIADEDGGIEWVGTFEDTYDACDPGGSFEGCFEDVGRISWV